MASSRPLWALVVLLSACSSQAPSTTSPAPFATATATPTLSPTSSPTPEPSANVVVTDQAMFIPGNGGSDLTGYQIIATLKNTGNGWAEVSRADFVVLDKQGNVTATGAIGAAFPQVLKPGATGYLVGYDVQSGVPREAFNSITVTPTFKTVSGPLITFSFTRTTVRYGGNYGFEATGFVATDTQTSGAEVGVICLGPNGHPLGAAVAQLMNGTKPGVKQAFQTSGPPTTITQGACTRTAVYGVSHDLQ